MSISFRSARAERIKSCFTSCRLVKQLLAGSERRGGCLVYLLNPSASYPKIQCCGMRKSVSVHVYEHINGRVPLGLDVLHKCDVKRCWEPDCLYVGTHAQNMDDVVERGRRTYYYGNAHFSIKLSDEQVLEVVRRVEAGEAQASLARELKVTRSLISAIINGRARTQVTKGL